MKTLKIIRDGINLATGKKKIITVYEGINRFINPLRQVYKILMESGVLEGADRVVWTKDGKVEKDYFICKECLVNEANESMVCKTCKDALDGEKEERPPESYPYLTKNKSPTINHPNFKYYKNDKDNTYNLHEYFLPEALEKAEKWLLENRRQYTGEWVAIWGGRLLTHKLQLGAVKQEMERIVSLNLGIKYGPGEVVIIRVAAVKGGKDKYDIPDTKLFPNPPPRTYGPIAETSEEKWWTTFEGSNID